MEPLFSPTELSEIHAYHQPEYVLAAIELVASPLVLVLFTRFLTQPLFRLTQRLNGKLPSRGLERMWGGPGWAGAIAFAVLFLLTLGLVSAPIDVWFGFVREHQFGMSKQTWGHYLWDVLKGEAVQALSVAAVAFGVFGLARKTRHWWWIVGLASAAVLVLSIAADPYRARLYVDEHPLEAGALRTRLTQTLARAGIDFAEIYVVETSIKTVRVEAAFAGTGPTRTILLTDTLLQAMTEDEIVAAVSHEAGHVGESRTWRRVFTPLAVLLVLALAELLFRASVRRRWFGIETYGDIRVLPLLVLAVDLSLTAAAPIAALQARYREVQADDFAVRLTQQPAALASLLVKVARMNKEDPDPPRWFVWMGASHPPIAERIARVQKNAMPPPTSPVKAGTSEQQSPGVIR